MKDTGWCPRGGGQSRTGGGVPEEVVSQGQGVVSQRRWSVKDRGWCPRGGGQSRTGDDVRRKPDFRVP